MRLQEIMTEKKITQCALAKKSGVSQAQISRLIAGTRHPTLPTLYKLAQALGVPVATLLDEQTDPKPAA